MTVSRAGPPFVIAHFVTLNIAREINEMCRKCALASLITFARDHTLPPAPPPAKSWRRRAYEACLK